MSSDLTDRPDPGVPSGTWNFRDLGGTPAGGRSIAPGVLFRSATLSELDDGGRRTLAAHGVTTVHDLRGHREIGMAGTDLVPDSVTVLVRPFNPDFDDTPAHETRDEAERSNPLHYLQAYNRAMPTSPTVRESLVSLIGTVAEGRGGTLIHCAAGKDRTGWAVAVLLMIAGVGWDDIMADYLKSNDGVDELRDYLVRKAGWDVATDRALLGVDESYLVAARDAMTVAHGSFEGYLDHLGVDPATVAAARERLLGG
jgi:protein-tyrosine phosphatase